MSNVVDVNVVEDKSVQLAMERKASDLLKKYEKKRKINEKILREPKSKASKISQIVVGVFCAIIFIFAVICSFSSMNSYFQHTPTCFAGYSRFTIISGSMTNSGFKVGDKVVVKAVDTNTLQEGDIIAFYCYSKSYTAFDVNTCKRIDNEDILETKYVNTIANFLGFQSDEIKQASKSGASIIFHKIKYVLEDTTTGQRWFKTYGTSNTEEDKWYVEDKMVVGAYSDSNASKSMLSFINTVSSPNITLLFFIPMIILGIMIFFDIAQEMQLRKLQLDCIEEKRKITDPICVKNKVGLYMDKKSKYKILAQADADQRLEYIKLLWADGTAPNSIQKYCLRKELLLRNNRRLLEVNRECQEMFRNGVDHKKIAEYYTAEKAKLETAQRSFQRIPKDLANKTE